MSSANDHITSYGFTAVPASATVLLNSTPELPAPPNPAPFIPVSATPIPSTNLAKRIQSYARSHLPLPTFNHSMRVYHYGLAIKKHRFPTWSFTDETYFLSCMLHDIGTTEENMLKTRLSFEFQGGMLAMGVLQQGGDGDGDGNAVAPLPQAESVAEAIIRHQDLCGVGKITAVGQLLQLATIFDNTGTYADLVHPSTIEDVSKAFPRLKWATCFAATIKKENSVKPWAHTTALGEDAFPSKVLENKLMEPYE